LLPLTIVWKTVDHILSSLLGLETKSDLDLMREQLLACNEQMKKAWGAFEEHKLELIPADKAKAYEALREAQDKLNEAWAHFKGVSTRVYESRKQEWEEKQRNFKARITANIEKNEAALEKARSALERQEANLESNREKLESARGDAYRERLEGWIEEGETLIESIKQNIERTEGWLSEDRAKLDQM
jgi:multidrug resistance efflux pump